MLREPEILVPTGLGPDLVSSSNSTKLLDPVTNITSHQILKPNKTHHEDIDQNQFIYSWNEDVYKIDKPEDLLCFSPSELIGCTFLCKIENEEKLRAEVARKLNDWDADNHKNINLS